MTFPFVSDENQALNNAQAANFLGINPKTLANWRSLGLGPNYIRYGDGPKGRVVYDMGDLIAFRDASRVQTGGR